MLVTVVAVIVLLYLAALIAFHVYLRFFSAGRRNFSLPNAPPVVLEPWYFPFFGPLHAAKDHISTIEIWKKKYGDMFSIVLLGQFVTFVTKSRDVKRYLIASESELSIGSGAKIVIGAFSPEPEWLERYPGVPAIAAILTPKYLQSYSDRTIPVISDVLDHKTGSFWPKNQDSLTVDFFSFMYKLILRINTYMFASADAYTEEFLSLITTLDITESLQNPMITAFKSKIGVVTQQQVAFARMVELLDPMVKKRVALIEQNVLSDDEIDPLYELVLYCMKAAKEKNDPFSTRLVAYFVFSILFVAQFNTYVSSTFLFIEQMKNDRVKERIQEETKDVQLPANLEMFSEMPFIDACVTETIRIRNGGRKFGFITN
jgi:hypothetical protein